MTTTEEKLDKQAPPDNGAGGTMTVSAQRTPVLAGPRGLELRTLEDYFRFAQYVIASGLAPKGIDTPAAALIVLQMGAEIGLTPMASLQNIASINGRPSVWGDAMLAVCRASGVFDEEAFDETISGDGQKLTATCTVRRLPRGKPIMRTFSMDDAKQASLQGKAGPWTQYPRRMLQMRARSWALRDGFADVLRGFRCAEEAFDIIDVDSAPVGNPNARVRKSDLDAVRQETRDERQEPALDPGLSTLDPLAAIRAELAACTTQTECVVVDEKHQSQQVHELVEMRKAEIKQFERRSHDNR